jgi:hypothetical protein
MRQARRPGAGLAGRFDDHHPELARMLLDQIDPLGGQIDQLTALIEQTIAAIPAAKPQRQRPARVAAPQQPATRGSSWRGRCLATPTATASIPKPASCWPRPCRSWTAWTRSPGSAATPPRSSSPRLGWT